MIEIAGAGINSFALGSPNPDLLEKTLFELQLLNNKVAIFITISISDLMAYRLGHHEALKLFGVNNSL